MKRIIVYYIFIFLFVVNIYPQVNENDLDLIKRYLWINKELSTRQIQNTRDISSLIYYLDLIIKKDKSIYSDASIKLYFSEMGYDFYNFITIGRIDVPINQTIAIDKEMNINIIDDTLEFINNIVQKVNIDSANFLTLVSIYNKINFKGRDIKFLEEYNKSIFGPKLTFALFNNIEKEGNKLSLMKMYIIEEQNFTDRYQISYTIENNIFSIKKILVSRN